MKMLFNALYCKRKREMNAKIDVGGISFLMFTLIGTCYLQRPDRFKFNYNEFKRMFDSECLEKQFNALCFAFVFEMHCRIELEVQVNGKEMLCDGQWDRISVEECSTVKD